MTETQKKQLAQPFKAEDIEWRIAATNSEKTKGLAVAYVDSRAIQERLDNVLGCENWQNEFTVVPNAEADSSAYVCAISVYSPERNEWIKKSDGAGPSDIEPVKGGLSGALKRAASVWSIGRYLYGLEGVWVDIEQKGKASFIKKEELEKLKVYYNRSLRAKGTGQSVSPPCRESDGTKAAGSPNQTEDKPKARTGNEADIHFRVVKSDVRNGANGTQTMLTLQSPQNKIITGYMRGNPGLREGQIIHRVKIEERNSPNAGRYNIIHGFENAA